MTQNRWTVREVLSWTTDLFVRQGVDRTARLDAELLLAKVLRGNRLKVYLELDRPLDETERAELRALVVRRANGEPVAYLLGQREFYGLDFKVDARVLVPRPETEILVDEALTRLAKDAVGPVVDVGAGSGAIACALAQERPALQVLAVELQAGAAALARENATALGLAARVQLVRGDLLAMLRPASVALIASNPPYVAVGDSRLQAAVARWEPAAALYGGADGLDLIRRLLVQASTVLAPGGSLLIEVGEGQPPQVAELAAQSGLRLDAVRPDLAGIDRVVVVTKG